MKVPKLPKGIICIEPAVVADLEQEMERRKESRQSTEKKSSKPSPGTKVSPESEKK